MAILEWVGGGPAIAFDAQVEGAMGAFWALVRDPGQDVLGGDGGHAASFARSAVWC